MEIFKPDMPFFKGNLHMHTTNSDGQLSPQDAKARYRELGYDFIAVTDHRVRGEDAHYYGDMLVLPGIELDYFLPHEVVHLVGVGVDAGINEDIKSLKAPQEGVDRILSGGGFAVMAHPAWSLNSTETISGLNGLHAAEVYNAVSAAPFNGDRADSSALLDAVMAGGKPLNLVAADDSHWYQGEEGQAFIRLQADELTEQAVMAALKGGRYHASRGPAFHQLTLTDGVLHIRCSEVRHITVLSDRPYAPGRNFTGDALTQADYAIVRSGYRHESVVRVVIEDKHGRRAWSNPILTGEPRRN